MSSYEDRLKTLRESYRATIEQPNRPDPRWNNGVYERFIHPVLTNAHVPPAWRYDLNPQTNPHLLERQGVNAAFNAGAILWEEEICMMARVEGIDRKSFFGLAKSRTGIDGFRFVDGPVVMPETDNPDVNVYDMRLTRHEDGWIYGVFCTERKDPAAPPGDLSSAVAQCGIARTKDLKNWDRLADLKTPAAQQRNAVLHPEFVRGKYAFYTRPQDSFIQAGSGGGIGWGLSDSIENAEIKEELIINRREYHTIKEVKNGMGAPPFKTDQGWLHVAHGVRECAWGLRYVLYCFLCDLHEPWRQIREPAGYFIAPFEEEFIGDVGNVIFSNGSVMRDNGEVFIYYASADTRMHVARTDIGRLLDYCLNTPEDPLRSAECVKIRRDLLELNRNYLNGLSDDRKAALEELF